MFSAIIKRLEAVERAQLKQNVRGTVKQVDPDNNSVRVAYGDNQLTDWLPVQAMRAGKVKVWSFPTIGEPVIVSHVDHGSVQTDTYNKDNPPVTTDINDTRVDFPDGSYLVQNSEKGTLEVYSTKDITIKTDAKLTVESKNETMIKAGGDALIEAKGAISVKSLAKDISLNDGSGVVTGAHICQFTGHPHSDCSSQVTAGK